MPALAAQENGFESAATSYGGLITRASSQNQKAISTLLNTNASSGARAPNNERQSRCPVRPRHNDRFALELRGRFCSSARPACRSPLGHGELSHVLFQRSPGGIQSSGRPSSSHDLSRSARSIRTRRSDRPQMCDVALGHRDDVVPATLADTAASRSASTRVAGSAESERTSAADGTGTTFRRFHGSVFSRTGVARLLAPNSPLGPGHGKSLDPVY